MNIIEDSPTVIINSLAQKKMACGENIYNLSAGEPKLPMHEFLKQAAADAMNQGKILYSPVSGISELKYHATEWMNRIYHCSYQSENCLIVNGGKFGIYLLLQTLLNKGDEVIIISPYWVSYPAIIKLFDGTPIIIETQESEGWKITPEKLIHALSEKSRILIINNGSNPTGVIYTKQELEIILAIAKKHDLIVISDEVYSGLTYDNNSYISCGSFPDYQDNVIVIQSCSKNFAMTGWRVGFVFAHNNIINKLTSLVSQSTSGVTTISQWVAVAALKNEKRVNTWVRNEMQKRRDIMINAFCTQFDITLDLPSSALYAFIPLEKLGVINITSTQFCAQVIEEVNVACVPGIAFGKEDYVRFSFGAEENDITNGVKKLAEYLQTHKTRMT